MGFLYTNRKNSSALSVLNAWSEICMRWMATGQTGRSWGPEAVGKRGQVQLRWRDTTSRPGRQLSQHTSSPAVDTRMSCAQSSQRRHDELHREQARLSVPGSASAPRARSQTSRSSSSSRRRASACPAQHRLRGLAHRLRAAAGAAPQRARLSIGDPASSGSKLRIRSSAAIAPATQIVF
jgi:hypothetical protein